VLSHNTGGTIACCTEDIGDTRNNTPFEVGEYNGDMVYAVCTAGNSHVASCGFHEYAGGGKRYSFDPEKPGKFQCGTWLFYTWEEFEAYKAEQEWMRSDSDTDINDTAPRSANEFTNWTKAEATAACKKVGDIALLQANRCGISYWVSGRGLEGNGTPPGCFCNTQQHCPYGINPSVCYDDDGNPVIEYWCDDGNQIPPQQ